MSVNGKDKADIFDEYFDTKPIIIDGINVAECEFLRKCVIPDNEGCKIDDSLCCDVGNCYYKQLQRLKQINFELISKANAYDKLVILANDRLDIIDRLKQVNEELKKKINTYVCSTNCHKYIQADKYKNALEEIREIIKTLIIEMPEYHDCYYKDECGDNCTPKKQGKVEYCCYENVDKILTIINEVLNDRN